MKLFCAEVPQIALRDACLCDDAGAGCGVFQSVVMAEDDAEALRHGIQRVGGHFGEEVAADDDAVGVIERHGGHFIKFQNAPQMPQVKWGVVDDDAVNGGEHLLKLWPDAGELCAVADIPVAQPVDFREIGAHPAVTLVGADEPFATLCHDAVLQNRTACGADASASSVCRLKIQSCKSHGSVLLLVWGK